MKKITAILLSSVVFVLAGCGNQGGSSDAYNTEYGTTSKTNYDRGIVTNNYQGGALSPGGSDAGVIYSTNNPSLLTNGQSLTIDPERTNNLPQN